MCLKHAEELQAQPLGVRTPHVVRQGVWVSGLGLRVYGLVWLVLGFRAYGLVEALSIFWGLGVKLGVVAASWRALAF